MYVYDSAKIHVHAAWKSPACLSKVVDTVNLDVIGLTTYDQPEPFDNSVNAFR